MAVVLVLSLCELLQLQLYHPQLCAFVLCWLLIAALSLFGVCLQKKKKKKKDKGE